MPVQGSAFFRPDEIVVHVHGYRVSPVGFDGRTGKLAVDQEHFFLIAVGRYGAPCDVEVVAAHFTCGGGVGVRVCVLGGPGTPVAR